jgi:hypothetical protein
MSTDLIPLAFLMFLVTYPSRALGMLTPGSKGFPAAGSTTSSSSVRPCWPPWRRCR